MKRIACILACVLGSVSAYANHTGWQFKPGNVDPNHQFHWRYPAPFHDDITPDQHVNKIKLSKAEQHQALVWGISQAQEQRYVALSHNRSAQFYGIHFEQTKQGVFPTSTRVTPVEVLGLNARTDAERQQYARQDAQQQMQYMAKFLAFNAAYTAQAQGISKSLNLPVVRHFNTAKYAPGNYHPVALQPHDVLMLYVKTGQAVAPVMISLLQSIRKDPTLQLNVYFMDAHVTKSQIVNWARMQNVPPEMVHKHQVTLNFGHGKSVPNNHALPALLLIRGGQSHFVNMGRF